jgi:transposase-like protein
MMCLFALLAKLARPAICAEYSTSKEIVRSVYEIAVDNYKYARYSLYKSNAIESLNMRLRKVTKKCGHFPSDEAMFKLIYMALKILPKSGLCRSETGSQH